MTRKIQAKKIYLIVLTLFFILPSFVSADEARFIYPANKSLISVPEIRIIGKIGNNNNINLAIKNKSGEKNINITSSDNYFNQNVQLVKGTNTVSITAGSVVKDSLEIIYTEDLLTYPNTENYLPYYLHSDKDLTDKCKLCHSDMQKNVSGNLKQKLSCITSKCHDGFDQGKFKHGPFEAGICIVCHNPHGSNSKFFLEAGINTICTKCHPQIPENDHPIIGHPVSAEVDPTMTYRSFSCVSCHDSHSSEHDKLLGEDEIMIICVKCHPFGS